MNREIDLAFQYHDETKHSYWSIRSTPHYLDWANKPSPFKVYPRLDALRLPRDFVPTGVKALASLPEGTEPKTKGELSLETLASLLFYSAGVTKEKSFPGGITYFRAAACAGALYPIEVYIVCGAITGLSAGVYHFGPGDFSLRSLRAGDFRGALARAANHTRIAAAPVTLVYTAISWRSSWKYRDRAYRYHYWDNGAVLANAIAMAAARGFGHEVVMGFVDAEVNNLVGVDGKREFALGLLPIGEAIVPDEGSTSMAAARLELETIPLSDCEVEYAAIEQMHLASSLVSTEEVGDWRQSQAPREPSPSPVRPAAVRSLRPRGAAELPDEAIESVIQRRASTRRFARKPISIEELSTIVGQAVTPVGADVPFSTSSLYFIANDVAGLEPGSYHVNVQYSNQGEGSFELLKAGSFREKAAYLTLEQDLGGDASVTFFLMADLRRQLEAYGNRGYRLAQMESGIRLGRMYLAAYALGRGATGLTFFDDDVTEFFSPHAAGKSCLVAAAVGVPGRRPVY